MKKLTPFVLSGMLLLGTVACTNSRTSTDAPGTVDGDVDNPQTVEETREDASSEIRQDQLNSDIRAREQRNNITGGDADRADADLESEVRAKLEANIPRSKLTIEAEDGLVTITGTVPDQKEYDTIEPLAREIKGVQDVRVDVAVVPPTQS